MFRKGSIAVLLALSVYLPASAQVNMRESSASGFLVEASYAAQLPGGNLAQKGLVLIIISDSLYFYKTSNDWLLGIQGAYLFGNVLKESNLFDSISTSDGNIIANDGGYPQLTYFERGWDIQLSVGRLFPWGKNPNSGIIAVGSLGYLQHFINIQVQGGEYTPQITGQYMNGYKTGLLRVPVLLNLWVICTLEIIGLQTSSLDLSLHRALPKT